MSGVLDTTFNAAQEILRDPSLKDVFKVAIDHGMKGIAGTSIIPLSWNDGTPLPIMVETPRRNADMTCQ